MELLFTTKDKSFIDKEFLFLEEEIKNFHFLEDLGKYFNHQEVGNHSNPLELHLTYRVDDYISKILNILKDYEQNIYIDQKINNLLNIVIKVYSDNENWGADSSDDGKTNSNFQNALKYFESYLNQLLGIRTEDKGNDFVYRKKQFTYLTCMQKIIVMHLINEVQKVFFIINRNHFNSQSAYIAQIAIFLGENATNIEMNMNSVIGHLKKAKNIKESDKHRGPVKDLIAVTNWFKQIGDEKLAQKAFDYLPEYEKSKNL